MAGFGLSPLDHLDEAFIAIGSGPRALTINGTDFGGALPSRPIPLVELKQLLLRKATPFEVRDAVVAEMIYRASADENWAVGIAGVLLPGLRRVAARLTRGYPGDPHCVDAEVIAGFFEALACCHPDRPRVSTNLLWAAYRCGHKLSHRDVVQARHCADTSAAIAPARRADHPDFVLARAVREGVISTLDAEVISATRLDSLPFARCAEQLGCSVASLRRRRSRAEARLVPYLRDAANSPCPISG